MTLVLAIVFMSVGFMACGRNDVPAAPDAPVFEIEEPVSEPKQYDEEITMNVLDIIEESEEDVPDFASFPFTTYTDFNENRAWVQFDDNGTRVTALIDRGGMVLYQITENVSTFNSLFSFEGGYAWYVHSGGYTIIDKDGNITNTNTNGENNYIIIGRVEGQFLAAEHISDMTTNEYRFGTIDAYGNIIHPFTTLEPRHAIITILNSNINQEALANSFINLGDGIITFSTGTPFRSFYNVNSNRFVDLGNLGLMTSFSKGKALMSIGCPMWYITSSSFDDFYFPNNLQNSHPIVRYNFGNLFSEGLIFVSSRFEAWHDDRVVSGPTYINHLYEVAVELTEHVDLIRDGSPFSGGYAVLRFFGLDGNSYIAAIDRNGSLQYEPIQFDGTHGPSRIEKRSVTGHEGHVGFVGGGFTGNGWVQVEISREEYVISPRGEVLRLGVDDISAIGNDVSFGRISNGFIRYDDRFISLDGRTVISEVFVKN